MPQSVTDDSSPIQYDQLPSCFQTQAQILKVLHWQREWKIWLHKQLKPNAPDNVAKQHGTVVKEWADAKAQLQEAYPQIIEEYKHDDPDPKVLDHYSKQYAQALIKLTDLCNNCKEFKEEVMKVLRGVNLLGEKEEITDEELKAVVRLCSYCGQLNKWGE